MDNKALSFIGIISEITKEYVNVYVDINPVLSDKLLPISLFQFEIELDMVVVIETDWEMKEISVREFIPAKMTDDQFKRLESIVNKFKY